MTPDVVAHIVNQAFWAAFWLCAPILIIAFIAGIVINLVQVATSLQDSSFSTIPRLAVFVASVMLLLPYMLKRLSMYAVSILSDLGRYAH